MLQLTNSLRAEILIPYLLNLNPNVQKKARHIINNEYNGRISK